MREQGRNVALLTEGVSRSAFSCSRPVAAGLPRRRSTNVSIRTSACSTPTSLARTVSNWIFGPATLIRGRWHGSSASVTHLIRALPSVWLTNVAPPPRETAHRGSCTSQLRSAGRLATGRRTFPTTDSSRTLSCIIIRCDLDIPNRITCDTSRHHHLASRRGTEHDFLSTLRAAPAPDLFVVRLRLHRRREPVLAEIHAWCL
jgi:hypothetical protein